MTLESYRLHMRLHVALKTTLAAASCATISIIFHMPHGYLAPLIATMVIAMYSGAVSQIVIPTFLGLAVAGGVSVLITSILFEAPAAYLLCMLFWLAVWLACTSRFVMAQLMGGIVSAIILFTAIGVSPQLVGDAYVHFLQQAFLAFAIATLLDHFVWPTPAQELLHRSLATVFDDLANELSTLQPNGAGEPEAVSEQPSTLDDLLALANRIKHGREIPGRPYLRLIVNCRLAWSRLEYLRRGRAGVRIRGPSPAFEIAIAKLVFELAAHCRRLSQTVLARHAADPLPSQIGQALAELEDLDIPAGTDPSAEAPSPSAMTAATSVRALALVAEDLARAGNAYNRILDIDWADVTATPRFHDLRRVFEPSLRTVRAALKTALVVLIVILGQLYLEFPGSTIASFYAVVFGLIPNLGQVYLKGKSGVVGVALALIYGFGALWLLAHAPYFPVLIGLFSLGVFVSILVATAGERVAYGGIQAALIMAFIFFIYDGPEWTLQDAVTRAAALMISAIVAFAVHNLIWPVDPLKQLHATMAAALSHCAGAVRTLTRFNDPARVSEISEHTNALEEVGRASATMLQDAQYMLGRQRPEARRYLDLVRALEGILAELQTLDAVIRRYPSNTLIKRYLKDAASHCGTLASAFDASGQRLRGKQSEVLIPPPAVCDALYEDIGQTAQTGRTRHDPEEWRQLDVVRNTLKDITGSLSVVQGKVATIVSPS